LLEEIKKAGATAVPLFLLEEGEQTFSFVIGFLPENPPLSECVFTHDFLKQKSLLIKVHRSFVMPQTN